MWGRLVTLNTVNPFCSRQNGLQRSSRLVMPGSRSKSLLRRLRPPLLVVFTLIVLLILHWWFRERSCSMRDPPPPPPRQQVRSSFSSSRSSSTPGGAVPSMTGVAELVAHQHPVHDFIPTGQNGLSKRAHDRKKCGFISPPLAALARSEPEGGLSKHELHIGHVVLKWSWRTGFGTHQSAEV